MHVLWATEGSENARQAGRLLPAIVAPEIADLTALAVVPEDPLPWLEVSPLGIGHAVDRAREDALRRHLRESVAAFRWPAGSAKTRVEVGDPARIIVMVAEAERADLIVMGARSRAYEQETIGPTCSEVLIHTPCPVLVVRSDRPWRSIVLATDGSDSARPAEEFLARLAPKNATIHVVTAQPEKVPLDARPASVPLNAEERIAAGAAAETAARLRALGFTAEAITKAGRPAPAILEAAAATGADLVVIGTHGRTGWRRAVLGSVASEVTRHAATSVLVVPSPRGRAGG